MDLYRQLLQVDPTLPMNEKGNFCVCILWLFIYSLKSKKHGIKFEYYLEEEKAT